MRILDRHILNTIVWPLLFCAYTLILLFLIGDVFDHLNDLLRNQTSFSLVIRYYSLLVPFAYSQTICWALLLSLLYLFTTFNRFHELVAMKAAGQPIMAIAKPLIFLAICLSIVTFIINDRVVPFTFQRADEIKDLAIETDPTKEHELILHNISILDNEFQYFIRAMYPKKGEIHDVVIHTMNRAHDKTRRLIAKRGTWANGAWTLYEVSLYQLSPDMKIVGEPTFYQKQVFPELTVLPSVLISAGKSQTIKSIRQTQELADRLRRNGISDRNEQVDIQEKIATPWMNLGVVLIAIPFLARTCIRREMMMNIIFTILCVFVYYALNALFLAVGRQGLLPPALSAWLGNLVVAGVALYHFDKGNH